MCGIIGIMDIKDQDKMRSQALTMAAKIRHRGPDWSGIFSDDFCVLAHERLAIVDVEHGAQPLHDIEEKRVLAVNGEIYDHKELRKLLKKEHPWQTRSDCEILLYLYDEYGPSFLDKIDGIFAFCLYDAKKKEYFAARDHIGIIPLYIGWDKDGVTYIASEMKAIEKYCEKLQEFPPGHYYLGSEKKFFQWYKPGWMEKKSETPVILTRLREELEKAVKRQLMSDVPYGILISGGLDSSLIAAIAMKFSRKRVESDDKEEAWWPRLHSFSVGLKDSPDLRCARKVAEHLGSVHHEVIFTVQEGIDALRDVIYHLETYDVTSIRASTPMYLMARKIRSTGIKMVLSGEGADEVFGGYLYFHMAPDAKEFHEETVRKLQKLSKYDCLRANKSLAAWGIEARVPFLDKDFLDYAMSFDPADKMCKGRAEKYVLRKAFEGYLPEDILWRQKEQFSDGVGYSWIDSLKAYAEQKVTDKMLEEAQQRFPIQPPATKEAYLYREIFDKLFPSKDAALTVEVGPSIACSSPTAYRWSKQFEGMADPSGRAVGVHKAAVKVI
ncbi:asparagine synthase B [Candidatus Woesearchaeota archaeon CG10_big_fil_rev_8_21_14_0_10_45_16]|nr:MAG: asparagine synthase B [Candidatus Woesearchaeota archaeon CG10_big_fil_rev_8_21_14_0_10_45_16]